jgi:hypothetical protein
MDAVTIDGQTNILPGAFQGRSALSTPRRDTIRVGDADCGGSPCDVTASQGSEIQRAVWTAWPHATVEIYPSSTAYAGNAIISWPMTVLGAGPQPEDVVLQSNEENPEWAHYNLWSTHSSLLTVLRDTGDPVHVRNLTLRVDSETVANARAVTTEYTINPAADYYHTFERLRVESVNTGLGLYQAFFLGDRVHLQDVLIHGDFDSCVTFGMRRSDLEETPATTCRVVNLTCRLTGSGIHAPQSGLDVASVVDSVFVNLAIQFSTDTSLFRAQRRSIGDTGATALDAPTSYTLHSVHVQHYAAHSDGYNPPDGTYTEIDLVNLNAGDPFFVDTQDSHLDAASTAMDAGVDPASVHPDLSAGTSLDGVSRAGRAIDRGCYEQGL